MRAAILRAFGSPDGFSVETWPDPVPGPGEVLVQVHAVCVNRTDVHVLERTNIGRGIELPHIGGLDPAGVVVACGPDVDGPPPGTAVVARPMIPCLTCRFCLGGRESVCERPSYVGVHRPGGFAELVALPARAVVPVPPGVDHVSAAVAAHSVPIALHLLEAVGQVGPGDRVLIVGAAGGLGMAVLQVARRLGATVIAAAQGAEKLAALERLGADHVVSYEDPTAFAPAVRAATSGLGVTVAVDNVGSPELWAGVVASLDKGARILTCGAHAGGRVEVDLSLFYRMQWRLLATAGTTGDEFRRALDLVADGSVRTEVHRQYPLEAIADAFRELLERRNRGKIVLRVAE
jgi:NADPH:quinone reductase-like Zn-dependent oxidoreductase